jgi:hypothetical protein
MPDTVARPAAVFTISVIGNAAGTVLPGVPERERLTTRENGTWG